jgi:hypothetical protein
MDALPYIFLHHILGVVKKKVEQNGFIFQHYQLELVMVD